MREGLRHSLASAFCHTSAVVPFVGSPCGTTRHGCTSLDCLAEGLARSRHSLPRAA